MINVYFTKKKGKNNTNVTRSTVNIDDGSIYRV